MLRQIVSPKEVQQKPDIQPKYTFNEPKAPKTASQPVGTLNTKTPSIKELLNPKVSKEGTTQEPGAHVSENEPLELENLLMHWRKYAFSIKEQNKSSVFAVMTKHDPKIINDNTFIYEVQNEWMQGVLKSELNDLLSYLRPNLKNGGLQLEIRVLEEKQAAINPTSPQDKYKILAEKNPNLQMLQRMFNLDMDY